MSKCENFLVQGKPRSLSTTDQWDESELNKTFCKIWFLILCKVWVTFNLIYLYREANA